MTRSGSRRVDREARIHLLVERELLLVERELREQPILVEQVVGDAHRVEQVVLADVLQLARALEQEEQLRLQRRRARVAIEALEERILVRLLQHQLAAEAAREPAREAGLADADRPFDDDETMRGQWRLSVSVMVGARRESFKEREARGPRARRQLRRPVPVRGRAARARYPAKDTGRNCARVRPGCGIVRSGSAMRTSSSSSRSRSMRRGPQRTTGCARPSSPRCSSARAAARAARAE